MKNKDLTKEKEYLFSKGWVEDDRIFIDPNSKNGYSLTTALDIQNEYDTIDKIGRFYYRVQLCGGYCYSIRYYTDKNNKYKTRHKVDEKFEYLNDEASQVYVKMLNEGQTPEEITDSFDIKSDWTKGIYQNLAIVIFKEKYGNRHFIINNAEEFCDVAYKIFLQRVEENWYYFDDVEEIEKPSMTQEEIDKLPDGKIKSFAQKEMSQYNAAVKNAAESQKGKKIYDRALDETVDLYERKKAALDFIFMQRQGEYEGFTVYKPEST
jgi:hypothetical protein